MRDEVGVHINHTINPLSAKLTKWPNTLKQFVGNLPTNCLSVFGHFVGLALKGLKLVKLLFLVCIKGCDRTSEPIWNYAIGTLTSMKGLGILMNWTRNLTQLWGSAQPAGCEIVST